MRSNITQVMGTHNCGRRNKDCNAKILGRINFQISAISICMWNLDDRSDVRMVILKDVLD
ncbi:hypothetical protein Pyn_26694 [Prunus yedoensis var. nudiflora]|uniref:Uncharacterized protein n=1 Tax=Prunus yedoensis var. nudiflora TaxID=2094558 RepID=A0A314YPI0_PRUYE|nr:hypothetical protein Pyn_26694 [Prunus yedoensis var. nudiflora]